jgi:hypothetical protein
MKLVSESGLSPLRKNKFGVLEKCVEHNTKEVTEDGENYMMRTLKLCTLGLIL